MRSFKNYLIALSLSGVGGTSKTKLKWSVSSDSGAIPTSWDATDPTKDAGETSLESSPGNIVDCMPLNDINIIYKEHSTHGMRHIGGVFVFSFFDIFLNSGILSRDCVVDIGGKHVVLTRYGLIVHDGSNLKRLGYNIVDRYIFKSINRDAIGAAFLAHNIELNEVWVCIPIGGSTVANRAIIWNYEANTFTTADIGSCNHMAQVPVSGNTVSTTWDTDVTQWDATAEPWDSTTVADARVLIGAMANTALVQYNSSYTMQGSAYESSIIKSDIAFADDLSVNLLTRINLQSTPTQYTATIGCKYALQDSANIINATYAASDDRLNIFSKGRYHSIALVHAAPESFELSGITVQFSSTMRV